MTQKSAGEPSTIVERPADKRPVLGARPVPLHIICMRGAEALESVIKQSIPELDALSVKLIEAASASSETLGAKDVAQLMTLSNDLRGMASTMGSEITSEIANAIYELCEADPEGVYGPLVVLLAEAARQVIGYRCDADDGRLKKRVEALLVDVRAAIDAA